MKTESTNLFLLTISAFWSSSGWSLATLMSFRRQRSVPLGGRYKQDLLYIVWRVVCRVQFWYRWINSDGVRLHKQWIYPVEFATSTLPDRDHRWKLRPNDKGKCIALKSQVWGCPICILLGFGKNLGTIWLAAVGCGSWANLCLHWV